MSNSSIQQGLNEMVQLLQVRNQLESEHIQQIGSLQQSLTLINELVKEKMLLDDKSLKNIEEIEDILENRKKQYEEELELRKLHLQTEELIAKIEKDSLARAKAYSDIKKAALIGTGVGALNALGNTITTVFKVGKIAVESFINVLNKVGGAAFNVGKSLLMLPWNMFKSLISAAANASGSPELLNAIENVRKEWGSFSNSMSSDILKVSTFGANLNNLATANMKFYRENLAPGRSMMRVWESMAAMMKDVGETLSAMGPTLNQVIDQFKEADGSIGQTAKSMIAMQKGLGLAKEEFAALAKVSARSGQDIIDIEYEMGNLSLQLGDKFGISAKKISSDVGKMMKDVDHFGNLSTKQLTSVAAYTAKLGIETGKLLGLMDKFDQFEDAADSASKLSQAFGLQIDSMEMMRAEDPGERFDMIRQAMDRAGLSTDNMRRQSYKLLGTLTGLDAETVKQGFSSKNLGKSYDEVKQAVDEASNKQLDQTEVLKKLADAIEKVNRSGGQLKDGFFKNFLDGIEKGIMRTPSFINMMTSLRQSLRTTLFQGMNVGEYITKSLGLDEMFNALGDHFKPANMKKFFGDQGIGGAIKRIFDKNAAKKDIDEAFDQIIKAFTDQRNGLMAKIYPQLQKLGEIFGKIGQLIITKIGEAIGKAFKGGASLIKGDQLGGKLQKEFEDSPWGKFITPVWDGLKSAFLSMFDGFAELAPVLLEKAVKTITWIFKGIQYLLSSKQTRQQLDASSATGSYLSFSNKKSGSDFEKKFDESYDKLSSGMSAVFNDDKLWDPLKNALSGAWDALKIKLLEAWEFVSPYIKKFLLANLVLNATTGAISGAASGFARAMVENPAFRKSMLDKLPFRGIKAATAATEGVAAKAATTVASKGLIASATSSAIKALPIIGQVVMAITALSDFASKKDSLKQKYKEMEGIVSASAAANAASFINVLTLGLLGDDTLIMMGKWTASIGESIMDMLGPFGESLGDAFSGAFSTVEGIGDVINGIFDLFDPDAPAMAELGIGILKVVTGVINTLLGLASTMMNIPIQIINKVIEKAGALFGLDASNLIPTASFGIKDSEKFLDEKMNEIRKEKEIGARKSDESGLLFKERKDIKTSTDKIAKLIEKEKNAESNNARIELKNRQLTEQQSILSKLTEAMSKQVDESKKKKLEEQFNKIQLEASNTRNAINSLKGVKETVTSPEQTGRRITSFQRGPSQEDIGNDAKAATTSVALNNTDKNITQVKENIKSIEKNVEQNSESTRRIVDSNSNLAIETKKVVVSLTNFQNDMMEGVNSIKTSVKNINVQVAVAVELNVKDLEKAIVKQKESLIRKAVSAIENNIAPTSTPTTQEKTGDGVIASKFFNT